MGKDRVVLFVHVIRSNVETDVVAEGKEVVLAVVRAAVEMIERRRVREEGVRSEHTV